MTPVLMLEMGDFVMAVLPTVPGLYGKRECQCFTLAGGFDDIRTDTKAPLATPERYQDVLQALQELVADDLVVVDAVTPDMLETRAKALQDQDQA